jgi:hypothetical protein
VLRETPGVTLKLLRFYGILFLIIRPLIRMKNPWRKRFEILRELLGAVFTVSFARLALVVTSLWRTTNPGDSLSLSPSLINVHEFLSKIRVMLDFDNNRFCSRI